jgi:DNA-binding NtrC family response regulator
VRVIAATNRPPMRAVAEGKLREDLFYRLNVFGIHLPPLRERREDIGLLAEHFLREINRTERAVKRFSPEAIERLASRPWPGNVRELRNAVQRAFVMAEGEGIDSECLPAEAPRASDGNGLESTGRTGGSLADVERRLIIATLAQHNGHKARTAKTLGISLKTLYNRLKTYEGGDLATKREAANDRGTT